MTEQERLEILDNIRNLKIIYNIHVSKKIIQDEKEHLAYLDTILDTIRECEEKLKSDSSTFN